MPDTPKKSKPDVKAIAKDALKERAASQGRSTETPRTGYEEPYQPQALYSEGPTDEDVYGPGGRESAALAAKYPVLAKLISNKTVDAIKTYSVGGVKPYEYMSRGRGLFDEELDKRSESIKKSLTPDDIERNKRAEAWLKSIKIDDNDAALGRTFRNASGSGMQRSANNDSDRLSAEREAALSREQGTDYEYEPFDMDRELAANQRAAETARRERGMTFQRDDTARLVAERRAAREAAAKREADRQISMMDQRMSRGPAVGPHKEMTDEERKALAWANRELEMYREAGDRPPYVRPGGR